MEYGGEAHGRCEEDNQLVVAPVPVHVVHAAVLVLTAVPRRQGALRHAPDAVPVLAQGGRPSVLSPSPSVLTFHLYDDPTVRDELPLMLGENNKLPLLLGEDNEGPDCAARGR